MDLAVPFAVLSGELVEQLVGPDVVMDTRSYPQTAWMVFVSSFVQISVVTKVYIQDTMGCT